MRPSLPLAVVVLVLMLGIVALVGASGITDADGARPSTTETTVLEQGPFQGSPVTG